MRPFSIVVLAAGASRRLGRPKQLLPFEGKTLIEHIAGQALSSGATEVIVVVGAIADEVRSVLSSLPLQFLENHAWKEGMGSSIVAGIAAIDRDSEAAVIVTCDQPSVTAAHLRALAEKCLEGGQVVASSYAGVVGVPCAFPRFWFERLEELSGDMGARELVRAEPDVVRVPLEAGEVDVDFEHSIDVP